MRADATSGGVGEAIVSELAAVEPIGCNIRDTIDSTELTFIRDNNIGWGERDSCQHMSMCRMTIWLRRTLSPQMLSTN